MLLLRQFFKFVQLLHSENGPNQLCTGFVLGMFMGFTPTFTLHWLGYIVLMLIFSINIGAALLAFALFQILAFALDPLFHSVGLYALTELPALKGLWTTLFHMPVFPYTRFNNTIVMGSFLISLMAALPVFYFSKVGVNKYRDTVVKRIRTSSVARAVMATKVYRLYVKYKEYSG